MAYPFCWATHTILYRIFECCLQFVEILNTNQRGVPELFGGLTGLLRAATFASRGFGILLQFDVTSRHSGTPSPRLRHRLQNLGPREEGWSGV